MSQLINKRCNICNTTIKYASYWSRHCRTKKHLKNLLKKLETNESSDKTRLHSQNVTECNRNVTECNRNVTDGNQNKKFPCKYCNKEFKQSQGRSRHEIHRCKERPPAQVVNNNTNTNSHNTNTNANNTTTNSNNTLTNNTTNQITLNVYGQEEIPKHFLTDDLFEKLKLCNGDLTKTYLLLNNELYLKNKQNNNIKYTNIQSEYCQILSKDNNWILKRLLEVMNERGITIREELEIEMERIVEKEGIQNNTIIPHPKIEQCQIMYTPLEKFDEDIDEEDEEIKELYKKYQIELYNLKKKKRKKQEIIHTI